ncbi:PREDICTED: uncharacterized protein LOC109585768 isoform X2 [Amphimedon queenslandica]|uniref:Uncharacterized protein n=1 Tax=Amphimedon queenslandica TaxID=400682 RepID=A0AAN0JKY3_AMPQE|nr:PREDICTED: uncharacterized protein LOC109585768 isoform X2 [Amphimedon queenslandica]|eukprot:XP_019857444.1 PREDICTED: uncharacterized protein LOC109585768 isoform X2 [Amphimedon queenslandica]
MFITLSLVVLPLGTAVMLSIVTALRLIILSLPFLHLFPGARAEKLCLEKSNIKNENTSQIVLSVGCSNGTASFDIGLGGESASDYGHIQLDYYCYHLNNMSLFRSENLKANIQVSSIPRQLESVDVQENSLCVFVCCAENTDEYEWYFTNGNGSTCSNKVDIGTAPAATSSIIEDYSTTATNNEWIAITESVTLSSSFGTTAELSSSSFSSDYFTTTTNNEWTAITESTTLSSTTSSSVGQIPFSSNVSEVGDVSEVTDTSVFLTTSDIGSSVTSSSSDVFPSIIILISSGIFSFVLILILSLLAILWYLRKQTSLKSKFNQDLIIGMDHLLKLPEEHLKSTPSTYTICTDPIVCAASHNTDMKQIRAIPASHELYVACNKSIGTGINNNGLLEVLEKDTSYDLQHIHDVLSSRMPRDERQTGNCFKQDLLSQRPDITNPPSVYNEIGYITV